MKKEKYFVPTWLYNDYIFNKTFGSCLVRGYPTLRQDGDVGEGPPNRKDSLQRIYWRDDTHLLRNTFEYPNMETSMDAALDQFYVLEDNISVRKESFGCFVLNPSQRATYPYTKSAYAILERLKVSSDIPSLLTAIKRKFNTYSATDELIKLHIQHFIGEAQSLGIVKQSDGPGVTSNARFFFTGVSDFPERHALFPYSMELELTYKCFLACRHCCFECSPDIDASLEQDAQFWKDVIWQLVHAGCFRFELTGGEVFSRADAEEIISYLDAQNVYYVINTDPISWKDNRIEFVRSLRNLAALQFSLDGSDEVVHGDLRGKQSFQKNMSIFERLKENRINFIIGTTFYKRNIGDLSALFATSKRFGVKHMISFMLPHGRARNMLSELCDPADIRTIIDGYCDAIRNGDVEPADIFWRECALKIREEYPEVYNEVVSFFAESRYKIFGAHLGMRINPYGQAYSSGKIGLGPGAIAGDLKANTIGEIWLGSEVLSYFRDITDFDAVVPSVDIRKAII